MNYDPGNEMFEMAIGLVNRSSRNIFLTGRAGTGKTTFLKYIRENSAKNMAVVAPTGVAAINAAGVTIHSFFQLPLSPFIPEPSGQGFSGGQVESTNKHSLLGTLRFTNERRKMFMELQLLIIDEVSMVRADVIDAIDTVLRFVRKRPSEQFGGVQVLFIGDLYQLPPVTRDKEWGLLSEFYEAPYFFNSRVLQEQPPLYVEFSKIYRQKDESFISVLNQVRNNNLDDEGLRLINERYSSFETIDDKSGYIILTTHNNKAAAINDEELEKLHTPDYTFKAEVRGNFSERNFPAEQTLRLKVGAQVMFIRNDSAERGRRYFNGKIGTVSLLEEKRIVVQCEDGPDIDVKPETWENLNYSLDRQTKQLATDVLGSFTQFPLRLAWAITIHKSQGLTFERAIIDAGQAFAPGQVYVALSRCTSLEGMVLTSPLRKNGLQIDPRVIDFSLHAMQDGQLKLELARAQKEYEQELLFELFNFQTLLDESRQLLYGIRDHRTSYSAESFPWSETLNSELVAVESTAQKFRNQLRSIISGNEEQGSTAGIINQRLTAAAGYFTAECERIIGLLASSPISTDNWNLASASVDCLKEISLLLARKNHMFSGTLAGFTVDSYLERQRSFRMPQVSFRVYGGSGNKNSSSPQSQLYARLKELRNSISHQKNLPFYKILPTSAIDEMSQMLPKTPEALKKIRGFGKTRISQYGQAFLDIINTFLEDNPGIEPVTTPARPTRPAAMGKKTGQTREATFKLFCEGQTIPEIAKTRSLSVTTIATHLSRFVLDGLLPLEELIPDDKVRLIREAIEQSGDGSLTAIRQITGTEISFEEIRLLKALSKRKESVNGESTASNNNGSGSIFK